MVEGSKKRASGEDDQVESEPETQDLSIGDPPNRAELIVSYAHRRFEKLQKKSKPKMMRATKTKNRH